MNEVDFKVECKKCGGWCCKDEKIFASEEELEKIGVERIEKKENGDCKFFSDGICSIYEKRPLECRIFPFDIRLVDGKLKWLIHKSCPAYSKINTEKYLIRFEKELSKEYSLDYVEDFARYVENKDNLSEKYKDLELIVLRDVNWSIN